MTWKTGSTPKQGEDNEPGKGENEPENRGKPRRVEKLRKWTEYQPERVNTYEGQNMAPQEKGLLERERKTTKSSKQRRKRNATTERSFFCESIDYC